MRLKNTAQIFFFNFFVALWLHYAIITSKHAFPMHYYLLLFARSFRGLLIPRLSAFDLCFQQLPRDLANINARKTMFDPYNEDMHICFQHEDMHICFQ